MLYWIIKPLVFIFYRIFYKFSYNGKENIPSNQPIIFAPNHVNAFIDPVAVGILTTRKVRFFARGDVFKGRIAKTLLNSMGISPMYRLQEGYTEIKRNDKTFEECRKRLSDNKVILIFPEGICIQDRRLVPLKKGLARIVFQTEETMNFKKEVLIIPVGLNYTAAYKFRSKLFIDIGKPLSVKEYEEQFKHDKVRTINDFTKVLENKMKEHLVIINNKDNDEVMLALEEIYLEQWINENRGNAKDLKQQYTATRELAAMVNFLETNHQPLLEDLKQNTTDYLKHLKQAHLRDHLLRPEKISKMNFGTFVLESQLILWGSIVYLFGLLTNYPPFFLGKFIANKKIKQNEFFASVYLHVAMIVWVIYFGVQLLTVALVFRNWGLLGGYALSVIILGYFCLWFYPIRQKIFGRWRLLRMVRKQRADIESFVHQRSEIIVLIEEARGCFKE